MKQKDLKIIAYLRQNARMALTDMSRLTQIPVSTLFDRLKVHTGSIITKHTALIDFAKLGYHTRVNIAFKVDRDSKEALREHLVKHECTNSVYKINNGFDFMAEGVFRQIKDMEEFIEEIEKKFKIVEIKTFYVIEDLKKESFLSNPFLLPIGEKQ